ncbi:MAG: hypothetical protein E6G04_07610 [Actinobacteria bacterium]|nr:MAG: hypothetical protein E6G04_07610 [Actinomycetota bacterium]
MAEGEEPSSEQAGGATPPQQPPELGVPSYGGPSPGGQGAGAPPTGTPPPSSTPPPAGQPSQPEIIEDYYPMVQPAKPAPPPRQRRGLGISRIVAIGIILLIGLGWVVTQVRHAHATANDKAACSSTLAALSTPATIPTMVHDLNFSDDKTLLGIAGDMTTHITQRNVTGVIDDLNRVIHRCNQISSEFKSGFKSFCDSHPGSCKETFHIGPF